MKIFATILNYNKDLQAKAIQAALSCTSVIVDSSGIDKRGFVKTDEPFGTGCYNKAVDLCLQSDAKWFIFVCSDVKGDYRTLIEKISQLPSDIGIYTPAIEGKGWNHNKVNGDGLQNIPFAEGIIMCCSRKVVESVGKFDSSLTKHGYGIDIYLGYACKVLDYKCVKDNDLVFYHPRTESEYSTGEAQGEMSKFRKHYGEDFIKFCRSIGWGLSLWDKIFGMMKRELLQPVDNRKFSQ